MHARANSLNKKRTGATASTAEKVLLARKTTLEANKNSNDDDGNVATCIKKNTTINLNAAHINQTMSNDHITKASCDDMFVRKKCLITCVVNNVNKHASGSFFFAFVGKKESV